MSLNADSVVHDPSDILSRMRAEITAMVHEAPRVWDDCLTQAKDLSRPDRALVITGCGDSYYAGLGARDALERMGEAPVLAWPAMEVTTYPSRILLEADLAAVSVSGKVGRTIDAVRAHAQRGGRTIAVTAHADSDLGQAADGVVATGVRGTPGPVPGTANYVASMLGLLALGAGRPGADRWREAVAAALETLPDLLTDVAAFCADAVRGVAEPLFVVSSGPDWGTANFAVAKLIEAAASVAVAQDLEEWAHEQYFVTRPGRTVIVIGQDEAARTGARRVVDMVDAIGASAITFGGGQGAGGRAALELPPVAPGLSPLVTWLPAAMFALEFAEHNQAYPFGIDTPDRMQTVDRNIYVPSPARA